MVAGERPGDETGPGRSHRLMRSGCSPSGFVYPGSGLCCVRGPGTGIGGYRVDTVTFWPDAAWTTPENAPPSDLTNAGPLLPGRVSTRIPATTKAYVAISVILFMRASVVVCGFVVVLPLVDDQTPWGGLRAVWRTGRVSCSETRRPYCRTVPAPSLSVG